MSDRQRVSEVCECLQNQTRKLLNLKPPNPYVTEIEIYKPSDVGKTTFEGLNIINLILRR